MRGGEEEVEREEKKSAEVPISNLCSGPETGRAEAGNWAARAERGKGCQGYCLLMLGCQRGNESL